MDPFPRVIQTFAAACAEVYQVDPALPAVSALTIASAALGSAVRCTGAVSGRETPCNLYTVIAAPSGYGKGVVGIVAKPMKDLCSELIERFETNDLPRLKADIIIAEMKKKTLLGELKGGALTAEGEMEAREKLVALEREIAKFSFEASQAPVTYTGSATGAALGALLKRNGEQCLLLALEAGDSIRVAAGRFSPDNKGDYDLLLSGYSCEFNADARITRSGVRLEAPCLSVLWAVQPTLLKELYGTPEAQERGLLARINVVQCGDGPAPLDDGKIRDVPVHVTAQWDEVIRQAFALRTANRIIFRAGPEAVEIFRFCHNEAITLLNNGHREADADLRRCRENAIRIATVIAAIEWIAGQPAGELILSGEQAARGVALARYFLACRLKLATAAKTERNHPRLTAVMNLLREARGKMTLRILRDSHGYREEEVRELVEIHPQILAIETTTPGSKGGRPASYLVLLRGPSDETTPSRDLRDLRDLRATSTARKGWL